MVSASTRIRRVMLALGTATVVYLMSPAVRILPILGAAAADDGGFGAGVGGLSAVNFTYVVSAVLAFIFGFAVRDVVQRHAIRAQAKRDKAKPAPTPKRA